MGEQARIRLYMAALLMAVTVTTTNAADDFGIVTDLSGNTEIKRAIKSLPATVGFNLTIGDSLVLGKNAKITIVSYDQCLEWNIKGPGTTELKYGSTLFNGKKLRHDRRLPVCYSMSAATTNVSDHMGGIVLRGGGPKDPVADLREEFSAGSAVNSTIFTLLMHELNSGNIEKSRPYYEEMKKRMPDAEIITKLAPVFNNQ